MPKITQLTSNSVGRLQDWYERAVNDPTVSRFLSITTTNDLPTGIDYAWSHIVLMDAEGHGMARLSPSRTANCFFCDFSCWVLASAGEQKRLIAGALMHEAFKTAAIRFNSKYVDWCSHGTNAESVAVGRRHALEIGNCPEGAWDNGLGEWVTLYTFRMNVTHYKEKRK